MKLTLRLTVLLAILIIIHTAYALVRTGTPHRVRPPATDLNELPLTLGQWVCTEPTFCEDTAGADASIERVYRNRAEQAAISVYLAVWTKYRTGHILHTPPVCYVGAGYEINDNCGVEIVCRDGATARLSLMHVSREGRSGYVLYWYQLDQHTFVNAKQMRASRWNFLGKRSWPPLVKVMLDIRDVDPQNAERLMKDLGEQILSWTSRKL